MQNIAVSAIPAQSFTTTINDVRYDFVIRSIGSNMVYDLSINEVMVCQGFRLVIGQLMLPYKYQEVGGNFILQTPTTEEPNYESFGSTQFLRYLTTEEAELFR